MQGVPAEIGNPPGASAGRLSVPCRRLRRALTTMTSPGFPNQPPPFEGRNLFAVDEALQHAVECHCAAWANPELTQWGAALGAVETCALADAARLRSARRTHRRRRVSSGMGCADAARDGGRRALRALAHAATSRASRA